MKIKKIKIVQKNRDNLKDYLKKALIVRKGKLVEQDTEDRINIKYGAPVTLNTTNGFYKIEQNFSIPIGPGITVPNGPFADHLSEIIAPVHINEIAINDDTKAVSSGYIKTKFNFVSEQYENWSRGKDDKRLPCIYLESDPQQTKTIMDKKIFKRIIPKARHFYDFNYMLKGRLRNANLNKNRNMLFGQDFNFAYGNAQREQYPFYNNIRFNYHTKNDFKNILKEYNFFEHFIDDYMNAPKPRLDFIVQETQEATSVVDDSVPTFDMLSWLQKSDFSISDNKLVFEPTQKYKNRYNYLLDKMAFVGKVRKLCRSKMKNIRDIHNNKNCQSEILFFRIDKIAEDRMGTTQSFWIPGDDDFVDFIDTQIRYGVKYTYKVNAYVAVFGHSYRYKDVERKRGRIHAKAVIEPSFKVLEYENIFNDFCRTMQPPQPVPNVHFVNESNKEDYIKIHMNLTVNSEDTKLNIIFDRDSAQEDLRVEYDRLNERPRFVYNNERALYEVYRMDFLPQRYEDLQGHKITEIKNTFPSTGVVFKDYIKAWRKYYYVFRSINHHGLVSNPTPVYEVYMTKDADESFLAVKTVPFRVPVVSQPTRTFMKLLQAVPASQHTVFRDVEEKSLKGKTINNLTLGVAEHPIWGKKFKFRITSSQTGRKIDFNIKVNLTKKKTMENSK